MIRFLTFLALAPTQVGAFLLEFPLDCTLGDTCFIQQYADRDPGPAATDFTCGPLSYDGHKGTDFAVPTLRAMQNGVTVLAAAAGTVKGVRDGMPDISRRDPGAQPLDGRDCGNGMVIDHGDGWETQYCHMAKYSVLVRTGQTVTVGTPLGFMGLSGNTEFPHLHLSVRKDGEQIDPFDPDSTATCGIGPEPALWATPIDYTPGAVIGAGFATKIPEWEAIRAGLETPPLEKTAPTLVLWGQYFGMRKDDQLRLSITGPQGLVIDETISMEKNQAQGFRAVGKRLRAPNWASGTYTGEITLMRDGAQVDRMTTETNIP